MSSKNNEEIVTKRSCWRLVHVVSTLSIVLLNMVMLLVDGVVTKLYQLYGKSSTNPLLEEQLLYGTIHL